MGAVGFTSGDPNKVDVAGDTMTGNLQINASLGVTGLATVGTQVSTPLVTSTLVNSTNLTVGNNASVGGMLTDTYQGVTGDLAQIASSSLSTGITSGGLLSINADPTKFDVSATTGWVFDYNPNGSIGPTNPQLTYVNFPGQSAIVLTGPPTQQLTFVLISSAGALIQQAFPPTRTQFRTHLVIGFTAQSGGTIVETKAQSTVLGNPESQLYDLARGLGGFNISALDNKFTPNGANLMVNTSGGPLFFPGSNIPNHQDPHVVSLAPQSPTTFNRVTATTILPLFFNTIDVANYDPNGLGIVTPVGGGANTSTIFRVFVLSASIPGNEVFIQYGQTTYASLAAARDAIGTTDFIINPALIRQCLAGWIVATRTATNLSDPAQAFFVHASKFSVA